MLCTPACEYDEFLLAPIDEDSNGLTLNVRSALLRLGLDPGKEAARLARLPAQMAVQELSGLIAAMPPGSALRPAPGMLALRLICQLPRHNGNDMPARCA
jgi:hypothetical protein